MDLKIVHLRPPLYTINKKDTRNHLMPRSLSPKKKGDKLMRSDYNINQLSFYMATFYEKIVAMWLTEVRKR